MKLAGDYLNAARILSRDPNSPSPPIILLAWQAAENSLKALAVGHTIREDHDLRKLIEHLRDNNQLTQTEIEEVSRHALWVMGLRTYSQSRYPDNDPAYWERFRFRRGRWVGMAIQGAERIHEFAKQKIL